MPLGFLSSVRAAASALIWAGSAFAAPPPTETAVLQINWKHQFQFAGYYAAIENGRHFRPGGQDDMRTRAG